MSQVHGTTTDKFAGLVDYLETSLASGADVGASIAVYHHEELVADLWGGYRDEAKTTAVGPRHPRERLVDHQDHDVPGRPDALRPRRTRLQRPRGHLLAGVRRQRQGGHRSAPPHESLRRTLGLAGADRARAAGRLGTRHVAARRPGAVVGRPHPHGVPRRDPGIPHRRGRAANHRARPSGSSSRARSPTSSAPTSSSGCPSPKSIASAW